MRFIENIFVSESIEDLNTVLYSLKRNIPVFNIYIISSDENGRLEVMPSAEYLGRFGKWEEKTVCGVAAGKLSAYRLLTEIIDYGTTQGWKADEIGLNILKE